MSIEWWHWMVLGLVLVAIELAVSGALSIIFFGAGAFAVGLLALFGLGGPVWMQFLLFTIFSSLALSVFRRPLQRMLAGESTDVDSMVGDTAVPLDDIPPGGVGRAELRGSVWTARNRTGATLTKGQRCAVVAVDRLTIILEPEGVRP